MGRPAKDFHSLMLAYNARFGKSYIEVDSWLSVLRSKYSVRAMSRLIKVDRGVLTRKFEEMRNENNNRIIRRGLSCASNKKSHAKEY